MPRMCRGAHIAGSIDGETYAADQEFEGEPMPKKFLLMVLSSVLLLGAMAAAQSDNCEYNIIVIVCLTAEPDSSLSAQPDEEAMSPNFAASALQAAARIRNWQMHLAYTIKNGYPLSEYWIASDRDRASDALQMAVSAATGEADRAALVQLVNLFGNVQSWSDARLEDKKNLRLANYYMSASALDNDESFQNSVSCTNSLMSMLASRRSAEETTCR